MRSTCLLTTLLVAALTGCVTKPAPNPAAPGFDAQRSDPRAIMLADRTMEAMGGRDGWDASRCIAWSFFGARRHLWDRATGDVRIEGTDRATKEPFLILMNVRDKRGRAWLSGKPVMDGADRATWMQRGYEMWVNDSYWLVMPYKLKDTGVTLRDAGSREMEDGRPADVVTLTFDNVGVTPQNRYDVYVAHDSGLVEQWDFYATADDDEPRFSTPWHDWQPCGAILLSGDRGDGRMLGEITVLNRVPAALLNSPAPIDWPITAGIMPGPQPKGE